MSRKAPEHRFKFNAQTVAAIMSLKPVLINQKDAMEQVEREMLKQRIEHLKALRGSQNHTLPEIVIHITPEGKPECGEKQAAPVRSNSVLLHRSLLKWSSAKSSLAPERSDTL